MTDKRKGQVLVLIQFALLFALVLTRAPRGTTWGPTTYTFGQLMFFAGGAIVIASFRALGQSLTANPVPLEKGELVTTGMYSRVRHPIYAGLLVMTLGMVLTASSWVRGVEWLALVALFTYKIRFEESMLVRRYPAYAAYMQKVPALLPRR
jgi:protein-S-isoprenylcysteine O-methyltransferase Ste14